jgi:hypothetical protein
VDNNLNFKMNISKVIITNIDTQIRIIELTSISEIKEIFGILSTVAPDTLLDIGDSTYNIIELSFYISDNLDFEILVYVNQKQQSD